MPNTSTPSTFTGNARNRLLFELLLNWACPYLAYMLLSRSLNMTTALIIVSLFPLAGLLFELLRRRRLNMYATFGLLSVVAGFASAGITGDARLLLLKGAFFVGCGGLVFLGSLLYRRPLAFYIARSFYLLRDPQADWWCERGWQHPYNRYAFRLTTVVWGSGLLCEALVRGALVFVLSPDQFLAVSPGIQYAFYGALLGWTFLYTRHANRRFGEMGGWQFMWG
jgi:hypothetical protein